MPRRSLPPPRAGWAVEALSVALGLLAGLGYALLSAQLDPSALTTTTNGVVVSLLVTLCALAVQLIRRVRFVETEVGSATRALEDLDERMSNEDADRKAIRSVRRRLNRLKGSLAELGNLTLTDYASGFQATDNGWSVIGENHALDVYTAVWDDLVTRQREIGDDDERKIIARVTHSNAIDLWTGDRVPHTQELLALQRAFVEAGGMVIRIFLGPDDDPNEEYQRAMTAMDELGIDVRYARRMNSSNPRTGHNDFLYLHDDEYTVTWESDVGGGPIYRTQLIQGPNEDVRKRWNRLWHQAKGFGQTWGQTSIPDGRQTSVPFQDRPASTERPTKDGATGRPPTLSVGDGSPSPPAL
jgi:hypothetical protein